MLDKLGALLICLLIMAVGAGLFLWDFYGDYIHFMWFIPFYVVGPIVFVSGLIIGVGVLVTKNKD